MLEGKEANEGRRKRENRGGKQRELRTRRKKKET